MKLEMVRPRGRIIQNTKSSIADRIPTNEGILDVRVRGNWIFPATILGRFKILMTVLRQFHLFLEITLSGELSNLHPSVFFLDQLSANIPLLRWWWKDTKILFYCHFPDLLLVQGRQRWWRRIWRVGFDWLEGLGMRGADRIVVNSGFTKGVVEHVWEGLGGQKGLGIVYPCVDTEKQENTYEKKQLLGEEDGKEIWREKKLVLSINRFERKKNIELAIRAYAKLAADDRKHSRLVVAGSSYPLRTQHILSIIVLKPLIRRLRQQSRRERLLSQRSSLPSRIP